METRPFSGYAEAIGEAVLLLGVRIRFDKLDALHRNRVMGVVRAREIAAFLQEPQAEFELILRDRKEVAELAQGHARLVRVRQPLAVKKREDLHTFAFFAVYRLGGVSSLEELLGRTAGGAAIFLIVEGALLRIAEDLVSLVDSQESLGVAVLFVIRVTPLSLNTIHAVHGLGVGVGADLKDFVIVDEHGSFGDYRTNV
jgi:hypothetical protein